jgi:superfamily II DNA or RNA helicase
LIITIKNHLRLTDIPSRLQDLLVARLQFPNPKYLENRRMGRWNRGVPRQLRYYQRLRGGDLIIPRGYIRQLVDLCRRQKIPFSIEDQRRTLPPVDFSFNGTLRPYQQRAVKEMQRKEFGTLCSPTGSGKTVMALYLTALRRQPTLIVVHTKELAQQWVERITFFLGLDAEQLGTIGGGKKRIGEEITIALVQSLYKCADEVSREIGHLLVDECHRTPSRTFTEAVAEFDSRFMLGLSATPYRRDQLSRLIFWHLGELHHQVDKARLVESGSVLPAEVIFRETDFKPYYDPVHEYSKMLSELTANDERNRLIAADVAAETERHRGVCLVLSDRKKQCETLRALLTYRHKVAVELLTGDLNMQQRQEVVQRIRQGHARVLIATGQLVGEGFDCRDLTTLFLATPVRFSGRLVQYLGRILRPAPGKTLARVYDYIDVHIQPLVAAANARKRVYKN